MGERPAAGRRRTSVCRGSWNQSYTSLGLITRPPPPGGALVGEGRGGFTSLTPHNPNPTQHSGPVHTKPISWRNRKGLVRFGLPYGSAFRPHEAGESADRNRKLLKPPSEVVSNLSGFVLVSCGRLKPTETVNHDVIAPPLDPLANDC